MELLPIPIVAVTAIIGFYFLDSWHRRKAWRDADAAARQYMRDVHGVEQARDGSWRKISR